MTPRVCYSDRLCPSPATIRKTQPIRFWAFPDLDLSCETSPVDHKASEASHTCLWVKFVQLPVTSVYQTPSPFFFIHTTFATEVKMLRTSKMPNKNMICNNQWCLIMITGAKWGESQKLSKIYLFIHTAGFYNGSQTVA